MTYGRAPLLCDDRPDLAGILATVLSIHGRYDWLVAFEAGMAILNHITDRHLVLFNNCGYWLPVREAGRVGRPGPRVSARLLN